MLKSFHILGNSAGVPTIERNVSATVLSSESIDILLDCGEGTYLLWKRAGYHWRRLKVIFISHLHPDHVCGLIPLLFYADMAQIIHDLTVIGPPELPEYVKQSCQYLGWSPRQKIQWHSPPLEEPFSLPGKITVKSAILDHKLICYGYRFEDDRENSLTYVTDTRPCNGSRILAKDVKVLIHEATFPAGLEEMAQTKFHTTVNQAIELAQSANVQRLVLTHFSPRMDTSVLSTQLFNNKPVLSTELELIPW